MTKPLLRKDLKPGDCFHYATTYIKRVVPHSGPAPRPTLYNAWHYSDQPEWEVEVVLMEHYSVHPEGKDIPGAPVSAPPPLRTFGSCLRSEVRPGECYTYSSGWLQGKSVILKGWDDYLKPAWGDVRPSTNWFQCEKSGIDTGYSPDTEVTLIPRWDAPTQVVAAPAVPVLSAGGLSAAQCLSRYEKVMRGEFEPVKGSPGSYRTATGNQNLYLSPDQMALAKTEWSRFLREKVSASEADAARKDRYQVVCERDEDGE